MLCCEPMKSNPESKENTPARSWHRQPDPPLKESPRAYEFFEYFLALPPSERTSLKVAQHFTLSERHVKDVRKKKNWNQRAKDRDDFIASQADEKVIEHAAELAFDWFVFEQENLNDAVETSKLFANKAKEIGRMPVVEITETITETTEDGKTIHKTIVHKPLRVTAADAPKFAEAALILARYAIETHQAMTRGDGINIHLPKPPKPLDQMTPDERTDYIGQLQAAREAMERGESFVSEIEVEQ